MSIKLTKSTSKLRLSDVNEEEGWREESEM